MRSSTALTLATLGSIASGYQLPAKLKTLYDQHKVSRTNLPSSKILTGLGSVWIVLQEAVWLL